MRSRRQYKKYKSTPRLRYDVSRLVLAKLKRRLTHVHHGPGAIKIMIQQVAVSAESPKIHMSACAGSRKIRARPLQQGPNERHHAPAPVTTGLVKTRIRAATGMPSWGPQNAAFSLDRASISASRNHRFSACPGTPKAYPWCRDMPIVLHEALSLRLRPSLH